MELDIGSALVGAALGVLAGGMIIVTIFMVHFRRQRRRDLDAADSVTQKYGLPPLADRLAAVSGQVAELEDQEWDELGTEDR